MLTALSTQDNTPAAAAKAQQGKGFKVPSAQTGMWWSDSLQAALFFLAQVVLLPQPSVSLGPQILRQASICAFKEAGGYSSLLWQKQAFGCGIEVAAFPGLSEKTSTAVPMEASSHSLPGHHC